MGGQSLGWQAVSTTSNGMGGSLRRIALAVDVDCDANATYAANIGVMPCDVDVAELGSNLRRTRNLSQADRSPGVALRGGGKWYYETAEEIVQHRFDPFDVV